MEQKTAQAKTSPLGLGTIISNLPLRQQLLAMKINVKFISLAFFIQLLIRTHSLTSLCSIHKSSFLINKSTFSVLGTGMLLQINALRSLEN